MNNFEFLHTFSRSTGFSASPFPSTTTIEPTTSEDMIKINKLPNDKRRPSIKTWKLLLSNQDGAANQTPKQIFIKNQ